MGRRAGFTAESRFFWKHRLPGLDDSHVRETVSFPDLLSPQSGGRRRCFKSIRAGRNIRDLNGFSASMDGHLRGYSAEGKVIWDFDTARDFQTVNGIKARGGSIDGPGPVIVNGMVLINSDYSRFGGLSGNVTKTNAGWKY